MIENHQLFIQEWIDEIIVGSYYRSRLRYFTIFKCRESTRNSTVNYQRYLLATYKCLMWWSQAFYERSKFRRWHEISQRNFNKDKVKSIFKKFRQNFNFIKGDWRWRITRRRISWWGRRNRNGTIAGDSLSRKTINYIFETNFEIFNSRDKLFRVKSKPTAEWVA